MKLKQKQSQGTQNMLSKRYKPSQDVIDSACAIKERLEASAKKRKADALANEKQITEQHLKMMAERESTAKAELRQREARLAGVEADKLDEAREEVNKIKSQEKILFRAQPSNWAILYAFLESEQNDKNNRKPFADYLNNCVIATKKQDLDTVVEEIKKYLINHSDKNSQGYKDLNACYRRIQEDKNSISSDGITLVTIAASRALFKARNPTHPNNDFKQGINIARGLNTGKEISRHSWGKILGGLFLAVIGATLTAGFSLLQTGRKEKKIATDLNRMFQPEPKTVKEKEGCLYSPVTYTSKSLANR